MLKETLYVLLVGIACCLIGLGCVLFQNSGFYPGKIAEPWRIYFMEIVWSVGVCWLATVPPILVSRSKFAQLNKAAIPILTTLWRSSVLGLALVWIAATNWPLDKSWVASLLGCYFIFLLLESVLAIHRAGRKNTSVA